MYSLNYHITLKSPVLISGNTGDINITETLDFIPGSSILGVLASKFIDVKGIKDAHENGQFYMWFLNGDLTFSNAYMVIKENDSSYNTIPIPLSIQEDKYSGDIYNLAIQKVDNQTRNINSYGFLKDGKIIYGSPKKKINFHHYRESRLKGHSEKNGGIFNYEFLLPEQTFAGSIYGKKQDLIELKQLFGNKFNIRLGRSRQAEYGSAVFQFLNITKKDLDFDTDELDDNVAILTFISPCILLNEYGFPEVSEKTLKAYLEGILGKNRFSIEHYSMKSTDVENYISIWKLKKPLEYALMGGSTIKLIFDKEIDNKMKQKLISLMENGLGERTNEGFGQIMINLPVKERYTKSEVNEKIEKPKDEVPQVAKDIFTSAIKDRLVKKIEVRAVLAASEFNREEGSRFPNNSLLGRLELMLKGVNKDEFINRLQQLKEPAKKQLHNCFNNTKTLWNFIIDEEDYDCKRVINSDEKLRELSKVVSFNLNEDKCFKDEIFRRYWSTFFREMRRINKKILRQGGMNNESAGKS